MKGLRHQKTFNELRQNVGAITDGDVKVVRARRATTKTMPSFRSDVSTGFNAKGKNGEKENRRKVRKFLRGVVVE